MHRLVCPTVLLLASFLLSHARHTVFNSQDGHLPSNAQSDVCLTPKCVIAAADILTSLDETMDPCDDFYNFACGGWIKSQELSDSHPWFTALTSTEKELDRKLRELLESEYKSSDPPFVTMLKDFYNTCVDVDKLEKEGTEPLKKMLRRLGGWPVVDGSQWDETKFDWVDTLILSRKMGYSSEFLLDLNLAFDSQNQTAFLLQGPYGVGQGSLNKTIGLEDPRVAAYYRITAKAAELLGADESIAEKDVLENMHFELAFADIISVGPEEEQQYNTEISIAELQKELPQVPWLKLINGLVLVEQVYENDTIINGNPDFLNKFADLITSTDKRTVANFMLFRFVLQSKDFLSEEWKEMWSNDEPANKRKKMKKPRWKQCLSVLKNTMEIPLTSFYVRHYFTNESKDKAMEMMKYIHKEFIKILNDNDWMDEKTREKAEEKANAMKAYIGYPDGLLNDTFVIKRCKHITITTESHLKNMLMFRKVIKDQKFSKLRKNREDTKMILGSEYTDLITVNAFYNHHENSIAIPAGILHHSYFDKDRPNYMNFAEIGYVIGHEITHGFDSEGRLYDKHGEEVNWWDKTSDEHFRKKVKCIIDQYDNYTMDNGMKLNGEKTQNEDIADNGGLKEAYLAYHSWTKDHGTEPLLPGVSYNQDQLFWLSAAHLSCEKFQPEILKAMMLTDVHSPGKFRIIGPMSNLPEFSKDFNCSPDSPMNRKYKCEVW